MGVGPTEGVDTRGNVVGIPLGANHSQGNMLTPSNGISLRGITTGRVSVRKSHSLAFCGMVCSSWPHWLPFLGSMGVQLEWIYFTTTHASEPDWLSMGRQLGFIKDDVDVLPSRDAFDARMATSSAVVVFMSGSRSSRTLMFPIASPRLRLLFTTGGTRRSKQPHWVATNHVVSHAEVGGVTDHVQSVQVWRPVAESRSSDRILPHIPRDLSTILNATAEGGMERRAPAVIRVEPPRVLMLRPGLYHGFGHYPLSVRPTPVFLTPSVYTKSRWVRRALTVQERLLMLDFPDMLGSEVPSVMLQAIARAAIPGKTLLAVWGVTGGGGGYVLSGAISGVPGGR